ncbi:MAG: HAD-IA family hydrolase [Chloroflexia bacterium]|nr:HAD-IA family hydrolase [Chloroflexia bacterium]
MPPTVAVRAVCFDLLTALLDSWSLWEQVASEGGAQGRGQDWRIAALRHVTGAGAYQPYDDLIARGAIEVGLAPEIAGRLLARWDELSPWPEVPTVLDRLALPLATATNCPESLAVMGANSLGNPFDVVVSAERAGAYKPDPRPYQLALDELDLSPDQVLFVAGSAHDVGGALAVGMPVVWVNRLDLPAPPEAKSATIVRDLSTLPDIIE